MLSEQEFAEMADKMEEFYETLQEIERKYCKSRGLACKIEAYDPDDCWISDAHWFIKDGKLAIISFEDIGTCGETDYEETKYEIPKDLWFSIDDTKIQEILKKKEELEKMELTLSKLARRQKQEEQILVKLNREIDTLIELSSKFGMEISLSVAYKKSREQEEIHKEAYKKFLNYKQIIDKFKKENNL